MLLLLTGSARAADPADDDTAAVNHPGIVDKKEVERLRADRLIVPDAEIKKNIAHSLVEAKTVRKREITVGVERGTVILAGSVGSMQERRLLDALARTSPGVREVRNRLRVTPEMRNPWPEGDERRIADMVEDEQLRDTVRAKLAATGLVRLSDLTVEVYLGVVVLSGPVADEDVRKQIRKKVLYVPKVRAVINNTWAQ